MDFTNRVIYLIIGPALFAACALGLSDVFGGPGIQRMLLESEGVPFLPDGRVDLARCQWDGK